MSKAKSIFEGLKTFICNPKNSFYSFTGKNFGVYYVELVLTTFCTLNCKGCSALMEYYKHRKHIGVEIHKKALDVKFD